MEKQRRVMLKLSGEALAGEKKTGFDEEVVKDVARQVKLSVDQGVQVAIVIGGGNFWRGRSSNAIDRPKADQIGMLATVMNCIYVSEIFRTTGMKTEIFTPFACSTFTKLFSKDAANEALAQSRHFTPSANIADLAKLAEPIVSPGNQTGEGWFLTGEMMELIHGGVPNIVCIQPFACLPNHIVGKGVIKAIRREHPGANIVAIDYDPGASEVNQLNRIKLMLSTAQKNLNKEV